LTGDLITQDIKPLPLGVFGSILFWNYLLSREVLLYMEKKKKIKKMNKKKKKKKKKKKRKKKKKK